MTTWPRRVVLKPRARARDDNGLKQTKQVLGGHLDLRRAAALARREAPREPGHVS
jgi:hypothetical protein